MLNANFVAWQPVLTDHQAYTLGSLSDLSGRSVTAYVTRIESDIRRAQGWQDITATGVQRELLSPKQTWRDCLRRLHQHRDDVHLFCSPFEQVTLILCLLVACTMGLKVFLISEPYSPESDGYFSDTTPLLGRLKAKLRPVIYRLYGILLRRRLEGVFAIGRLAVAQYCALGIERSRVHPFGYFVPTTFEPLEGQNRGTTLRLVFVGNLIRRKGVDLLLQALQAVRKAGMDVTLDIYGPGDASTLPGNDRGVHFGGTIPFGKVQEAVSRYDALVLPSRYDGWGVVVNEALSAGVPVICSQSAGASTLIERFQAGATYPPTDVAKLEEILITFSDPSTRTAMQRGAIEAGRSIEPQVAAAFMLSCIEIAGTSGERLRAPWYL